MFRPLAWRDLASGENADTSCIETTPAGAAEMARWIESGAPRDTITAHGAGSGDRYHSSNVQDAAAGYFAVVPGQYLLTVIDQQGRTAANLTFTVL